MSYKMNQSKTLVGAILFGIGTLFSLPTLAADGQCPWIWAPVCGVDGNTYPNDCFAGLAGAEVAYEGECATADACTEVLCAEGTHCELVISDCFDDPCLGQPECLPNDA